MSDTTLLWSCAFAGTGFEENDDVDHCIKVWKDRKNLVESLGIELKLLVPKRYLRSNGFFPVVDSLAKEDPELLISSPGDREYRKEYTYDQRLAWPRDSFQIIGNKSLIRPFDHDYSRTLLHHFDLNVKSIDSLLGEGGFSIKSGNIFIYADLEELSADFETILEENNYCGFQVPPLIADKKKIEEIAKKINATYSNSRHLDTQMACVQTPGGSYLLLVTPEYHSTYKNEVINLQKEIDSKLYVLDPEEAKKKAVNFIQLPTDDILISKDYPIITEFLRKNLDNSKIHSIETFYKEHISTDTGGGLRCRTNLIYHPS